MALMLKSTVLSCRMGRDLEYFRCGSGVPLLVVNPYGIDPTIWQPVFDLLDERFESITWRCRGFVEEESAFRFKVTDHAEDAAEILKHAESEGVHVISWCGGAKVALELYASTPELVRSLTFVAPNFAPVKGCEDKINRWQRNLTRMATIVCARPEMARAVLQSFSASPEGKQLNDELDSDIEQIHRDLISAPFQNEQCMVNYLHMILDYQFHDCTNILRNVRVPTLLLKPTNDRVVDPALCDVGAEMIRGSINSELRGAGHFCIVDRPEEITRLLETFVCAQSG
jgi:pimeloyl-ACP methyl ester carboxylesterase